ncbi:MAG: ThiF family adenylyltransferase [Thermoplasmata archaeon]
MNNIPVNNRYISQIKLFSKGISQQKKLQKSSALVIGAGALGNVVSLFLAGAGIGKIGIMDGDKVELKNLHRQIAYKESDIGKKKAYVLKKAIEKINSNVNTIAYPFFLSDYDDNLFREYDVIIDSTDNLESKHLINRICVKYGKPMVYGSVYGYKGIVSTFIPKKGACLECIVSNKESLSCNEGIIGPAASIVGSIQALEAIKYIIKSKDILYNTLLIINTENYSFGKVKIKKNPYCTVCSNQRMQSISIKPIELKKWMKNNKVILIDIRDQKSYKKNHIEFSINIPLKTIDKVIENTHGKKIVLYCEKGIDSYNAALYLNKKGILAYSLEGGIERWMKS